MNKFDSNESNTNLKNLNDRQIIETAKKIIPDYERLKVVSNDIAFRSDAILDDLDCESFKTDNKKVQELNLFRSFDITNDISFPLSIESLQQLEDVGVKVAGSIFRFFHDEENLQILKKLELLGISLKNQKKQNTETGLLTGETFLFTGTLSKLKRSDAEEMVEKNGGKIVSGVSSKLNYLVVGEDAGSKLEKAKKITAIKIISEEDFIKLLPG